MSTPAPPNVLGTRYASAGMREIFDPKTKIRVEREIWVTVLRAQAAALGPNDGPSDEVISAYESVKNDIDLDDINERERALRHDVKARIDSYNAAAGHEAIHRGMTSRDLTENVELAQQRDALDLVIQRAVAAANLLAAAATRYRDTPLVARSHNVPAQLSTAGHRFANFLEEHIQAIEHAESVRDSLTPRGIVGPVGTMADQLHLADDIASAQTISDAVADTLGFPKTATAPSQIMPRSQDYAVVSALLRLAAAPASFATTLRLMAGAGLAGEGFAKGQVGSSAMPHKMNARTSERITGFHKILLGYATMLGSLSGNQWNEGDVACSVVRRVAIPDAFFAIDGLHESFLTVLNEFALIEPAVAKEVSAQLPYLATTTFLLAATEHGLGREEAHALVKEHALAAITDERNDQNGLTLTERLGADERYPLDTSALDALLADPTAFIGAAPQHVDNTVKRVTELNKRYPDAANYTGGDIL